MDSTYRVVKVVSSVGAGATNDMHEFKMTPFSNNTSVLMTVYQPRQYDLTTNPRFNLQNGLGWIAEGVFQEVEIDTGKLLFEWRSLDHVDPSEAWTLAGATDTSGDGLHEQSPWDYFHINSIDKNEEGDYLISARHVSAIYKISGKDGSIIWQLGGNKSSFKQTNFKFSYQHHARWMSENGTHTVFSFYDNASNNYNATGTFSHGWIISIDHIENTATMIKEWGAPEPEGGLLSTSQGNMQLLPNGGCHIGWGEHAYFSEHLEDGTTIQYAKVADRASNVMIYRSNKYNWSGQPVTKPALWSFSKNGKDNTRMWVSWNGATEVRSWNFYIGPSASGPWTFAGNAEKNGFETEFHLATFAPWSFAEARDSQDRALERSVIARTFVPSEKLRQFCNDRECNYNERVPAEQEVPYEAANKVDQKFLSTNRGFDTSHYYEELPMVERPAELQDEEAYGDEATSKASGSSPAEESKKPEESYYRPSHSQGTSNKSTTAESGGIAVGAGAMLGFTAAVMGFYFWRIGAFRKLQGKTADLTDNVTNSSFGSKVLGRYTRVKSAEDADGYRSGSSSSPEML